MSEDRGQKTEDRKEKTEKKTWARFNFILQWSPSNTETNEILALVIKFHYGKIST